MKDDTVYLDGGAMEPRSRLWNWGSLRFRIALALALALSIEGLMRSNINMAMVCMVNRTAVNALSGKHIPGEQKLLNWSSAAILTPKTDLPTDDSCGDEDLEIVRSRLANQRAQQASKYNGQLVISKPDQALIFTSFYAGGLAIIIPGSYLCDYFGAKSVVLIGAIINTLGTFFTPVVASYLHPYALVALRFVMGAGQGIFIPCMNVLIAHWFPLTEKSTAIAVATTGNQISVVAAMLFTAELCQISFLGGWPLAFYSYGVVGAFLCLFWYAFVYNSPSKAKNITETEINYIQQGSHSMSESKTDVKEIPWKAILSSPTVWAIALNSFSQTFMTVGTVTYIPSYYQTVLRMNLTSNGLMSSLPFIFQLITKIIFAWMADYLHRRNLMKHTSITKLFNNIASFGSGLCYFLLTFCDCRHSVWAIILVISALGLSSGFIPGYNTSTVCVAPKYTASVASFCRLLGQIAAVASPYMIGVCVQSGTKDEWAIVFYAFTVILFLCGLSFQLFGSASVQEWAKVTSLPSPNLQAAKDNNANVALLPSTKAAEQELH